MKRNELEEHGAAHVGLGGRIHQIFRDSNKQKFTFCAYKGDAPVKLGKARSRCPACGAELRA